MKTLDIQNITLHRAETRGHANNDWLNSFHTFSFADYFDPLRIQFGALRVINDDTISPNAGFDTHPHKNMEIITIPLSGTLEHKDNMGHISRIRPGEIQVMSTGTGITHSEYNASKNEPVELLQIWINPKTYGVIPRYDQYSYLPLPLNGIKQIISGNSGDKGSWIYQDAWFHIGKLYIGNTFTYNLKKSGNGVYVFVIEGSLRTNEILLSRRDGVGFIKIDKIDFETKKDSLFLIIEVPLNI